MLVPLVMVKIEPVIEVPPSVEGGVQETVNWPSLALATTFCGADGPPNGLAETVENSLFPTIFCAAIRKI